MEARQNVGDKVIHVLPLMNDFVVGLGMWVCFVATVINIALYQIINPLLSFSTKKTRHSQLKYRFSLKQI